MKSRLILVGTRKWPSAALLATAFADVGCEVEMVCPAGHPGAKAHAVGRIYIARGASPLAAVARVIEASAPDLILPCDDAAVACLQRLYVKLQRRKESSVRILEVLERSLGPPASHAIAIARSRLICVAREEGIRTPKTAEVRTISDLRQWISENSLPAMLKVDGTSGGTGVEIIQSNEAVEPVFERVVAVQSAGGGGAINVQQYIPGRDATSSIACWKGEILAAVSCEVIKTVCARGAASVVRLIDHPEMRDSAERLIRRLKLSGIHGFDFRLEEGGGRAYLLEMNARPTQISHLALGTGRDLPAAIRARLSEKPVPKTRPITERDVIALFPQEWKRDPASEFLNCGYHDVPWHEPGLIKWCVDHFLPDSAQTAEARSKHRLLEMLHARTREGRIEGVGPIGGQPTTASRKTITPI